MTTQIGDLLLHEGVSYRVKPFPLNDLGDSWRTVAGDDNERSRFGGLNTACRRKYVATWTIDDARLYLTAFSAVDLNGGALSIEDVFGTDRLSAFWYSGQLFSPFGDRVHGMFEPVYQFDHIWRFEHGVLRERTIKHNDAKGMESGDVFSHGR